MKPACTSQGKHPIYANWQRLLLTPETLAAVLKARPLMNVGIATGRPSGFWALDVDDPAALELLGAEYGDVPGAPFQTTGSGGWHFLFEMPADFEPTNSAGRLPKGIDVRGTGGQIVVPPSVSAKGPYVAARTWPGVQPNLPWLLDLVRPLPYERSSTPAPRVDPDSPDMLRASSYAQAVIARECGELAEEQHTRNSKAFQVACRLHELINAGWTSYDYAEGRYLEACESASANRPHPFPQSEAHAVWANAAHRVGDSAAELPPSMLGGERLDFPQAPAGPSTSPTGGGGLLPDLDTLLRSGISLTLSPPGSAPSAITGPGLNLPPEFWESRPVLKHIRAAAHARIVSADVALHTVLARLSALWPHQVRLDTGVRSPIAANVFTAVVGPSSAGKTSGVGVSDDILPRPPWLAGDALADGLPLGTGEGIAEAYMGSRKVAKLDALGVPVQLKTGEMKTESVRGQVRHNAFMYADEGEALAKLIERSGSTIGETIRRAHMGSTIGQQNGRAETTRIIDKGSYSLGLVIGFQPETCQLLLADDAAGTPQRFLWCWALDPSMPDDLPAAPGPLTGVWPVEHELPAGMTWVIDEPPAADLRQVTYPASIRRALQVEMIRRNRTGETDGQNGHAPVHLAKLSALLAQLEGRRDVTEDDWSLAGVIWHTSCRVRDHLIAYGRSMAGKARDAQRRVRSEDAADAEASRLTVLDAAHERAVERVALQVARRLQAGAETLTARGLRHLSASRDRAHVDEAIGRAVERRWIAQTESGAFIAGDVHL